MIVSKRKKNKSVPSPSPKTKRIPQQLEPKSEVVFDFSHGSWLKSYSDKNFTNYLKDNTMYAEYITKILNQIIPKISNDWTPQKNHLFQHCHEIRESDQAFKKYQLAIKKLHHLDDISQLSLWQFGFTENIRLICHLSGDNVIFPLLIDYHHLGYSSEKYNQKDYKKYKFCPIEKYL